jgi:hypothetical protein
MYSNGLKLSLLDSDTTAYFINIAKVRLDARIRCSAMADLTS